MRKKILDILFNYRFNSSIEQVDQILALIREEVEVCLTENDSSTHIIAKDLLERLK